MVNVQQLQDIANILRSDVLKMTTAARSGHPTSCLSCAEIMSVLFFNEMIYDIKNPNNLNNDEFILSKGHAAPILYSALFRTGCITNNLNTLRQINSSLEGHPIPRGNTWIKVATGSLGQGLSVGIGMALVSKNIKNSSRTYVLLGDSETAEGSVWEAAMLSSYYKLNNLCAIIDMNRLGQTGETMLGHDSSSYKKRFESFGWNAIIIEGHNIKQLLNAFSLAKKENKKPTVIIARTYKGNGVSFLKDKSGKHGIALTEEELGRALKEIPQKEIPKIKIQKPKNFNKKFTLSNKINIDYIIGDNVATRESYGTALIKLVKLNSNLIVLDAEVKNSMFTEEISNVFPEKFIQTFIAEQNMIDISIGISAKKYIPYAATFSSFLTRAHDQLRMAAISQSNITVAGSHSGVSIGEDGPSQMGLEDIALFRTLPNSTVFYPSDAVSTEVITSNCMNILGIKYIRLTRGKTPVIYSNKEKFEIGEFKTFGSFNNAKAVVVAAGITLHEALKAQKKFKDERINVVVVDCYCVKPFDINKLKSLISKCENKIVIVEDHYKEGGMGEMILSQLDKNINSKHLFVNEIPHSGTSEQLLEKYNINEKSIIKVVKELIN